LRIADYLDFAAAKYPDSEALVCHGTRLTYQQMDRYVHAVAHALESDPNLNGRVHLAIYSGNDHRIPILQLGANRADKTWLGVHVRNTPETNAEILNDLDCNVLAFSGQFESVVPKLKDLLPNVVRWICIDRQSPHGVFLEDWLIGHWERVDFRHSDMEGIACILPTGGTTGRAKGAAHSNRSIEMELVNLAVAYNIEEGSRLLTVAPLSHAAGQFALGFIPYGGANIILHEFDPKGLIETIAAERITHLFVPPTILYALLLEPTLRCTELGSMRALIVGAAPISPDKFLEAIEVFGPVLYEAYAQTETLIPVLVKQPADYLLEDGSVDDTVLRTSGRPTAYVAVSILDQTGAILPAGQPGEIVVRSAMGMSYYYKQPEATRETNQFDWHHTGDVGVIDSRGFVTLIDRVKDMIITGAFNVFPAEVENVINRHPNVWECIVIGVPDEKWGEAVKAIVRLKPGTVATEAELIQHCRGHLGGVKTPKTVEFWPDLPRSAVGKLLRREARARYWEGHWRAI
jgi:acyl-CoA synthetase (AMP-forming)/AMP-acid ligase II